MSTIEAEDVDFLTLLFGGPQDDCEVQAGLEAAQKKEQARLAALASEKQAAQAFAAANKCPKCSGSGYLAQFSHRKGGECYTCGGSGIFSRYR
jgi:DnaJ-class molecular chaperone